MKQKDWNDLNYDWKNIEYTPRFSMYEIEKTYILKALMYYNNNKTAAADSLGISVKTLYNKLHSYGYFQKPD